jgi:spermidine synthase
VKPWVELARATAEGGGTISLHQRDQELVIRVDGQVLMSSRRHGSEERLAEIGCAQLPRLRRAPRVLVGGLGMGFTLRAVLDLLPATGEVMVAELSSAVIDWNRGVLAGLAGRPLDDARVHLHIGDVADAMRGPGRFDAILLDVDNSPHALTRPANRRLYDAAGLAVAHRALCAGGSLALWSASAVPNLEARLGRAGFEVEVHAARAHSSGAGARHTIYAGRR